MKNKLVKISGVYLLVLTISATFLLIFYSRIFSWGDVNLIRGILPRVSLPFLLLAGIYYIWSAWRFDVVDRSIKIASIFHLFTAPLLFFAVLLSAKIVCPSVSIVSHRVCGMTWWIIASVTGFMWFTGILILFQQVLTNHMTRMAQPVIHVFYKVVGYLLMLFSVGTGGLLLYIIYGGRSGMQPLMDVLPFLTFPLFPIAGIYFLWSGIKRRKTNQYELFSSALYLVAIILYAVYPFLREAFCGSAVGVAELLKCTRNTFGFMNNISDVASILAFGILIFGWFTPNTERSREPVPMSAQVPQESNAPIQLPLIDRLLQDRRAWLIFFTLVYVSGMFLIGPYIIAVPFVVPHIPSGLYKIFSPAATFQKVAPPGYLIFQITYFFFMLLFLIFLRKFNRTLLYIFGIAIILIVILTFVGCAQIAKTLGP